VLPADLVILIIENNREDYTLVSECLKESFDNATVFHADTLQKGIDFIEKEDINIIFLNLILPDETDIQSFRSVHAKAPLVPVIILSVLGDTPLALESLQPEHRIVYSKTTSLLLF